MTPVKEEPEYDEVIRGAAEEDSVSGAGAGREIVLNNDAFIENPDNGEEAIVDQTEIKNIKEQMALNPPNPQAPAKAKKRDNKTKSKSKSKSKKKNDVPRGDEQYYGFKANANSSSNSEYQPMSPVNTLMQ